MNIFNLQQLVASQLMFIHKHRYFRKPLGKLSSVPKYLLSNRSLLILNHMSTSQLPFTLFRCHCKLRLNLNLLRIAKLPVIPMLLWIRRLRLFPSLGSMSLLVLRKV
jgi:hypothetical protein